MDHGRRQHRFNVPRMLWRTLDLLGKLWTAPNSLLGLIAGLSMVPFGARVSVGDNALRFENIPLGRGALTLGNIVLYSHHCAPDTETTGMYGDSRCLRIGKHEQAHTLQYQLLGPLFLPVYLCCGGISARNPFERAANDYAAGGHWWPWRLRR